MCSARWIFLGLAALAWTSQLAAQDALRYKFEAGDRFTYLVAQRSKPAQGPSEISAELTYSFEVEAVEGELATLRADITGKATRGPDAASQHPEAQQSTQRNFEASARFRLTGAGVPVAGKRGNYDQVDFGKLALEYGGEYPVGSGSRAMAGNVPQFFPYLGAGGAAKLASKVQGPNIFAKFPKDTPEVAGLLWTEEDLAYTAAAPKPVEVAGASLLRIDFVSGFTKKAEHRGLNFKGTYRMTGFALLDPGTGRPVAYKVDDAKSHYLVSVSGGNFVTRRIAQGRLDKANGGRTPIRFEAVDSNWFARLRDYAGLDLIAASATLTAATAPTPPPEDAIPATSSGLFGLPQ